MTGTTFALALMWCALRLALWIAEWLYYNPLVPAFAAALAVVVLAYLMSWALS